VTEDAYLNLYPEDTDLLKEYTVRNRIIFHGRLHHEEALKILQGSDYCIFYRENTRLNRAGFPTKFVESISCGVPVITTRTSDLAQYINNRGFLLEQDQFLTQFAACITQTIALSDKDRQLFSYINFTDRIELLFRE
jgi:glycosyltransferase involved in cell wall biosynthesis